MNTPHSPWKIWIDTGGTFTDCIATPPNRQIRRAKVLSSSALRGRIIKISSGREIYAAVNWEVKCDIFKGYYFSLLGQDHAKASVVSYNYREKKFLLDQNIAVTSGQGFEIYAGEEAPILAARLVTQTPLSEKLPFMEMRLGSTRGTNALLERKGAKTALLVTQGFKDLLAIDSQQRPDIFALNITKPAAYYDIVLEVEERLDASGEVIRRLKKDHLNEIIQQLRNRKVETIAIALMHSYRNSIHEKQVERALSDAGFSYISVSSTLAPAIKILPRAKTALVNAYLSPAVSNYLAGVKQYLGNSSLKVMTSAGGLVDSSLFEPKDSLLSGPAGGVVGAARVMKQIQQSAPQIKQIIAFDMGGTSTDVSRYGGEFDYRDKTQVGDIELHSPSLAIETVAAGGGSCCTYDGHKLSVGPDSASAKPGPACYGFGGPLTLTDVNLLLGRVSKAHFGLPVSSSSAEGALKTLKDKIGNGYPEEKILNGLLTIANEKMTDAIRQISVRKGYDPKDHALVAFGGAGGQHACSLAQALSIKQVVVPYDAGLLSAYGMGHAAIERIAEKQLLLPLAQALPELGSIIDELQRQAYQDLYQEGFHDSAIEVRFIKLKLRFSGQESNLEVDYHNSIDVLASFRDLYTHTYGHWLDNQTVEVVSILLAASSVVDSVAEKQHATVANPPIASATQRAWVDGQWLDIPIYLWEDLSAGSILPGPALVVSANSSTFVESDWQFKLDAYNNALLSQLQVPRPSQEKALAEVQLALFTNRFEAIANEMGALLERAAFSVNVKERLDFSCALLDAQGELVVNAPHVPVHLGSLGICVRSVRKSFDLKAGDVIMTNHPGYGGSHLPDITLISPVFYREQLVGYVTNRAHHAELGGKQPGSMPPDARNLLEEGIVIPPTFLVKNGKANWKQIRQLFEQGPYPSRSPAENIADLNGALASIQLGVDSLIRLCKAHGIRTIKQYMQRLKDYAHDCIRQEIDKLSGNHFNAIEYLDDGTPIQTIISLDNGKLHISFEGSGGVHPANFNTTLAVVNSAVIYVLRLLVQQQIPLNEGLMEQVTLYVPEGSFLNPIFPENATQCPAVVGGNTETSQRVVDTLLKALGLTACSQGTMNNLLFGNDTFGYYETIGGGSGAGEGFAGAHAVHQHMTNTRITDPEVMELRYPVRLVGFGVRQGSGGAGHWQGGNGIFREILFLEEVSLTLLSQHRKEAPYGMQGGQAGKCGEQYVVRGSSGQKEKIEGVYQTIMHPGDRIILKTPGGGGYGKY